MFINKKNNFIFGLLLFSSLIGFGQTNSSNLDYYEGKWRWISNSDTLEIYLQRSEILVPQTNAISQVLIGWHRYVKDGTQKQSSFQYIGCDPNIDINSTDLDLKITIEAVSGTPNNLFVYLFWDLETHNSSTIRITKDQFVLNKLNWMLNGNSSLPKQITLDRVF